MFAVKVIVKGKARSRIALGIVAAYLRLHPSTSLKALKEVFPDSICPKAPVQFRSLVPLGVFQPLSVVQALPEKGLTIAHYTAKDEVLHTADGVAIAVTKSWTQEAFDALTIAAAMQGIAVMVVDENTRWATGTYELDFLETHTTPKQTATPASEESQPEVFDEYRHQAEKKQPKSTRSKRNGLLAVIILLALFAATILLQRGIFSDNIFGHSQVDTIVLEAFYSEPLPILPTDSVPHDSACLAVAKDSTPHDTALTAAPATPQEETPVAPRRKKARRSQAAIPVAQDSVAKVQVQPQQSEEASTVPRKKKKRARKAVAPDSTTKVAAEVPPSPHKKRAMRQDSSTAQTTATAEPQKSTTQPTVEATPIKPEQQQPQKSVEEQVVEAAPAKPQPQQPAQHEQPKKREKKRYTQQPLF